MYAQGWGRPVLKPFVMAVSSAHPSQTLSKYVSYATNIAKLVAHTRRLRLEEDKLGHVLHDHQLVTDVADCVAAHEALPLMYLEAFLNSAALPVTVRQYTIALLKAAELCPPADNVTDLLTQQVFCNVFKHATTDTMRGFLQYGLVRTWRHLKRVSMGGDLAPPAWDFVADLMCFSIWECTSANGKHMDARMQNLFASAGMLTSMEMLCREGSYGSHCNVCKVVVRLSVSTELVCRAIGRGTPNRECSRVCLSYFGTILKLQRILSALIGRQPIPHLHQNNKDMMTHMLDQIMKCEEQLLLGPAWDNGQERMRTSLLLMAREVLCESMIFTKSETFPISLAMWQELVVIMKRDDLGPLLPQARACHNPACLSMQGFSELLMLSELCRGCRSVRYCSPECRAADREAHRCDCMTQKDHLKDHPPARPRWRLRSPVLGPVL